MHERANNIYHANYGSEVTMGHIYMGFHAN